MHPKRRVASSLTTRLAAILALRCDALPAALAGGLEVMRIALTGFVLSLALASAALASSMDLIATVQYVDPFFSSQVFTDSQTSTLPGGPAALSAHVGFPTVCPPPLICGYTAAGLADASADLASGRLAVRALAFLGSQNEGVFAVATADFSDTLVFHLPPNMSSASITLSMDLHATSNIPAALSLSVLNGSVHLGFGAATDGLDWDFVTFHSGVFSGTLSATTIVQDGVPVGLGAFMEATVSLTPFPGFPGGWYDFDASHTATLSLVVPAGVTWQSDSGVFLTQVPEPSALQLALSGVAGVFAAVRVRRRGWRQALSPRSRFGRVFARDDEAA